MKISILPQELIDQIFSYIEHTYYENKRLSTRKMLFLKYKYEFALYFNLTCDPFHKYILNKNNKIFLK